MTTIEKMDNERVEALRYIISTKYGYVRELLKNIAHSIVEEFVSLGFIIMGYTSDDKTWKVSSFAEDFYQVVR